MFKVLFRTTPVEECYLGHLAHPRDFRELALEEGETHEHAQGPEFNASTGLSIRAIKLWVILS